MTAPMHRGRHRLALPPLAEIRKALTPPAAALLGVVNHWAATGEVDPASLRFVAAACAAGVIVWAVPNAGTDTG